MDSLETLLYEEQDNVAIVTLNRPEVHNAFNLVMQHELKQVWTSLRRNDDVRAVVLTGAGEKAFCTGIDRAETIEEGTCRTTKADEASGRVSTPFMFNDPGANINPKQNDLWKPVVAAVNGMACGGALYMLGESDIIIAAEHATFFDPHVTYGMVAGFESVHLLQKLPLGETLRVVLLGAHERMSADACPSGGAGLGGRPRRRVARTGNVGRERDRVRTHVGDPGNPASRLDGAGRVDGETRWPRCRRSSRSGRATRTSRVDNRRSKARVRNGDCAEGRRARAGPIAAPRRRSILGRCWPIRTWTTTRS